MNKSIIKYPINSSIRNNVFLIKLNQIIVKIKIKTVTDEADILVIRWEFREPEKLASKKRYTKYESL